MKSVDAQFSELVGLVYEGALEERPWSAFLSLLRERLDAVATTLLLRPAGGGGIGLLLTEGGSAEGIARYRDELFMADPFVALPPGQVIALHEIVPLAELERTELYRLCMAPGGLHDILGADIDAGEGLEARLRVARTHGARTFGASDKQFCAALLPHLARAVRIHARLHRVQTERSLFAGAVEQLAVGAVMLDGQGRVVGTNARARALLQQEDGLRVEGDALRPDRPAEAVELQRIVRALVEARRSGTPGVVQAMRISRSSGRADLGLIARPVSAESGVEGASAPALAVFISDPEERSGAPVSVLAKLFGFTPTEAQLALALSDGINLDEAALALGISRNTARAHLRAVFGKTGVGRQGALVRLILKSVASLG